MKQQRSFTMPTVRCDERFWFSVSGNPENPLRPGDLVEVKYELSRWVPQGVY